MLVPLLLQVGTPFPAGPKLLNPFDKELGLPSPEPARIVRRLSVNAERRQG
jgi:hypothetical protein